MIRAQRKYDSATTWINPATVMFVVPGYDGTMVYFVDGSQHTFKFSEVDLDALCQA